MVYRGSMRVAILSTIAWRTPPRGSFSRERLVSLLTEGLVERGVDVTLFATADSTTRAKRVSVCPCGFQEDRTIDMRLWESLHLSTLFEHGEEFDMIHNHLGYIPLTYSHMTTTPIVTTMYGFYSPEVLLVYKKYAARSSYVAVSEAGKTPMLDFAATIHPGIDVERYTLRTEPGRALVYVGPIHPLYSVKEAIGIARGAGRPLVLAGPVQDERYFGDQILPEVDGTKVRYESSLDGDGLVALMGDAHAFIFPIGFDEAFNLPVIEAMACGTPVVAFNRGCMGALVEDGRTGFLVDNAEQALEALGRIDGLDRRDCRARVEERFTVSRMVDEYMRLYERIAEREKREDHRPWGFYRILSDDEDCKVKRITVYPGQRLSYQRHQKRAEHWYIFHGKSVVTLDGKDIEVGEGEAIDIPRGSFHRIRNPGPDDVVFIEVQTGDYFGEDDIERVEDDYGRA
jgi:mannose-6-phosphate isomerase-like protein (cupin superfamily)